jgi:hypothetical protein
MSKSVKSHIVMRRYIHIEYIEQIAIHVTFRIMNDANSSTPVPLVSI